MLVAVSLAGSLGFALGAAHPAAHGTIARSTSIKVVERRRTLRIGDTSSVERAGIVVHDSGAEGLASGGPDPDAGQVPDLTLEELLQTGHQTGFRLAHRLAGRAELLADRLERRGVV